MIVLLFVLLTPAAVESVESVGCAPTPRVEAPEAEKDNHNTNSTEAEKEGVVLVQTKMAVDVMSYKASRSKSARRKPRLPRLAASEVNNSWQEPEAEAEAAEASGVTMNAEGDLAAFISGFAMSVAIIVGCAIGFSVLRLRPIRGHPP